MYTFDAPSVVVTDAKAARSVSVHRLFWRVGAIKINDPNPYSILHKAKAL